MAVSAQFDQQCRLQVAEGLFAVLSEDHIKKRPLKMRSEQFVASIKRSTEFTNPPVELSRHTGVLRPLSGKEECERLAFARSPKDTGTGTALCE